MTYVANSNGLYSVKWINSAYTGPIFNFRRSSDNVTLNFYVSGDGNSVGTLLGGTGTSLASWLSGATAFVTIWYDQSTLGNHATQTNNANQPTYNTVNKCLNFNSANFNRFVLPNGTVPFNNTNYTVVVKHGTLTSSSAFLGSGITSVNNANAFGLNGNTYINYWWGNDMLNGAYSANNTVTWKYDGSARYVYINRTLFTSAASSGRTSTSANNFIGLGETTNNNYANGQIFNIFIYTTALSDANRLSAESDVGVVIATEYPCFLQGTKILRFNPDTYQEEYTPIEKLRKGDLIPTSESGYKLIHAIGYRTLFSPKSDPNPSNRLYTFSKSNCPEIFEPLHITGEHCTLHRNIPADKRKLISEHMGDVYITEEFYRMPACLDDRAEPYEGPDEPVIIWHFALEHEYDTYNYGVYANGLLVESSSIRSLLEKSGMNLICSSESYGTK